MKRNELMKDLDKAAEAFAYSYVASIAGGTEKDIEYYAQFAKECYKAGYKAALGGYDPFKEYFEKDGEEEVIDEEFSV